MVSDKPSAYQGQAAFQFIKDVPASWDETRVLNGVPGEFVIVARRRGKDWFIGCMTGWTQRQVNLSLNFLGDEAYAAEIYADAADAAEAPKHVDIQRQKVSRTSVLPVTLAPGGGCAIRLRPIE
jgi:alpha-glucosidase